MRRRRFLRNAALGAAGLALRPEDVLGRSGPTGPDASEQVAAGADDVHLVILHTNDTHSRVDPFPMDGGPFQGLGGVARRTTLIQRVRAKHPNVLLLDAGDTFQGTPYFNFFKGEIEFRAMSSMGYDATTIGNHDFDNGVAGLVEMLPHASFPLVSANYDVDGSLLRDHVEPWIIREVGGVKVGIFGLGIAFDGLVLASLHEGVRYTDPYASARQAASDLRGQGCSVVVCLSHLGYRYRGDTPSDTILAQEVEGVDLILGGHTHTFMDSPDVYPRRDGGQTLVNQVGWAGMRLGRIDVVLSPIASTGRAAASAKGSSAPLFAPRDWSAGGYDVDDRLD
jgi:5'-nucleotidase